MTLATKLAGGQAQQEDRIARIIAKTYHPNSTHAKTVLRPWFAAPDDAPVDEISFSVYELYQLACQAAVKLLGSELDMQQYIQPLCSS